MTMILTSLLAATSLFGAPAPLQVRPTTSEDTAEGAEILRRILVDALDDAFARGDEGDKALRFRQLDNLGVVTGLWADRGTVQHSRVFLLPEVGLFFSLDAALPVVSREAEKGAADRSERAKDDEWERARRAVRGGGEGEGHVYLLHDRKIKDREIDPKAIDQTIDLVLRTVARHAARIEGLAPKETLTVALRLSGRGNTVWRRSGFEFDDGDDEGELGPRAEVEREQGDPGMYAYGLIAGGSSAREQNLVIRIALADLAGYAEGSLEALRQRAQINRY
jgi:hypothetical protein